MSKKLTEMLCQHEAVRRMVYRCSAGALTIGVGRNIDPNKGGIGLSDDEIDYMLRNDITRVYLELDTNFEWFDDLDEVRQDACIDICFNLGLPRFSKFVLAIAGMALGDYERAADEFLDSRWAEQVGRRAITVTNMIRTGAY